LLYSSNEIEIVLTKFNNLMKVLLCIMSMHNNNSTHLSHDWIESFFCNFFFVANWIIFFLFAFFCITSFLGTKWFVTSSCQIIEQSRIRKLKIENWKLNLCHFYCLMFCLVEHLVLNVIMDNIITQIILSLLVCLSKSHKMWRLLIQRKINFW